MDKIKIVIDTDPGCDDAIALMAALKHPRFDVLGITSIGGNVNPALTQANALGLCALMGRSDVPVYKGCDRPLVKPGVVQAEHVHGATGIMGLTLPSVAPTATDMDAADFILAATAAHPGAVTLVVIGPMTNVALAVQRDPSLPGRVREIVTMGGAFGDPGGNITPHAEFNIFCDPHAARIVYAAFPAIRVLPLDVTHKALQDAAFRDWVREAGRLGPDVAAMLADYAATYPGPPDWPPASCPPHDFHTIAALLRPEIYRPERGFVTIAVDGEHEGQTVLVPDAAGPDEVMTGIDVNGYFDCLKDCLRLALA